MLLFLRLHYANIRNTQTLVGRAHCTLENYNSVKEITKAKINKPATSSNFV